MLRQFLTCCFENCMCNLKSKQAIVKVETHITAGQLTAQILTTMFPQISGATIYLKTNHFKKFGTHSRQPESGRPNKLFGNGMRSLCKTVTKSSQISAKRLSEMLRARAELKFDNGLFNELSRHLATQIKAKTVPNLTNHQKHSRVTFCTRRKEYSWYNVFITNQSLFYVHCNTLMHRYCRRRPSEGSSLGSQYFQQKIYFAGP